VVVVRVVVLPVEEGVRAEGLRAVVVDHLAALVLRVVRRVADLRVEVVLQVDLRGAVAGLHPGYASMLPAYR
tara:strand:+ start:102 stop:317 length:216 start_codon:yes stop_codon:yes gene_type:complete